MRKEDLTLKSLKTRKKTESYREVDDWTLSVTFHKIHEISCYSCKNWQIYNRLMAFLKLNTAGEVLLVSIAYNIHVCLVVHR